MPILTTLRERWLNLIEPPAAIQDVDTRLRVRLMSALFIFLISSLSLVLTLRYLLLADLPDAGVRAGLVLVFSQSLWLAYVQLRRGQVETANWILAILTSLLIYILAALGDHRDSFNTTILYFITVSLFVSHFLRLRHSLTLAALHLIGIVSLNYWQPERFEVEIVVRGPVSFYVVTTGIMLFLVHYRSRLQAERERLLRESEQRYRMVSDIIPNYAFSFKVQPDGELVEEWITEGFKRITGYEWKDIKDSGIYRFYHADDFSRQADDLKRVMNGQPSRGEYRIFTRAGDEHWLLVSRYPVWNANLQRVVRYFGVAQDITERKQAEQQRVTLAVRQAQISFLRDFVRAFSHDFRTALATIETRRYLIQRQVTRQEYDTIPERLEVIHDSVTHMKEQLENLNRISDLTDLDRETCNLNTLLQPIVEDIASHQHGLTLVFLPNAYLPAIEVDVEQIQFALRQLLHNATHNTTIPGSITVRTSLSDNQVLVEVQDTGVGIPPEHLPHIFDLFYRVDEARNLASGGVGIGLSLVKMIVEAHGGTIRAESMAERGTTFVLRLPARSE